jgi:hypothetical protein
MGFAGTPAISVSLQSILLVITDPIPTIQREGIELPGAILISEPT